MPGAIPYIVFAGLAFVYLIIRMSLRHEERKAALRAKGGGDIARLEQVVASTQAEMARLRERVEVLEKLATDDDRKLADEISRLGATDNGASR